MGKSYQIFISNKFDLTSWARNHCAKVYENRIRIASVQGD